MPKVKLDPRHISILLSFCYFVLTSLVLFSFSFVEDRAETVPQSYEQDLVKELTSHLAELPGGKYTGYLAPTLPIYTVDLRLQHIHLVRDYAQRIMAFAQTTGLVITDVQENYGPRFNQVEIVLDGKAKGRLQVRLLLDKSAWPVSGIWALWPGAVPGVFPKVPPRGRLALVIDDWGYDWEAAPLFLALPRSFTGAVLPHLSFSVIHSQALYLRGKGVILHQPMEPLDENADPGPGAIYVGLDDQEIGELLAANLAAVPHARGMNNHMGSRVTADEETMTKVLQWLKEHGYYFLDSYTTAQSVVAQVGLRQAIFTLKNDKFLDHEDDVDTIKGKIKELVDLAVARGYAIGIGHVRMKTYQALWEMLPYIDAAGVELVTIDELLEGNGLDLF